MKIHGLDKVLFTRIPDRCSILVNGDTGVLKTTFAVQCIKAFIEEKEKTKCIFFTMKERASFLKKHFGMEELAEKGRIIIYDYDYLMEKIPPEISRSNIFKGLTLLLREKKEEMGDELAAVAIDPVNVLCSSVPPENLRQSLYHFLSQAGDLKTQNWLVYENVDDEMMENAIPFHFLSDGIIELGMQENQSNIFRYLKIIKMRGAFHSLNSFQISYRNGEFKVLGPTYDF